MFILLFSERGKEHADKWIDYLKDKFAVHFGGLVFRVFVFHRFVGELEPREVCSFVGGMDLTDGRYDNEDHELFHPFFYNK